MTRIRATSFADPADLLAYNRAVKNGKTPEQALEVGDNGLGSHGLSTVSGTGPCCAFSGNYGRIVRVFYGEKSVDCDVRDFGPRDVIDLNPDACKELGLVPPVSVFVDIAWL